MKNDKAQNPHLGSSLDEFLDEEGTREVFQAVAVKEVLAFQIEEAMKAQKLSRRRLAERMGTSRSQIGRLLDPKDGNVTLATLQRAAEMLAGRCGLISYVEDVFRSRDEIGRDLMSVDASLRSLYAGSSWYRWEPHIHAPGTVLNDQFKTTDFNDYLTKLEAAAPTIRALGVTDYYSLDCYERVCKAKRAGRLPRCDLIFPNVEMRLGIATNQRQMGQFSSSGKPARPKSSCGAEARARAPSFQRERR